MAGQGTRAAMAERGSSGGHGSRAGSSGGHGRAGSSGGHGGATSEDRGYPSPRLGLFGRSSTTPPKNFLGENRGSIGHLGAHWRRGLWGRQEARTTRGARQARTLEGARAGADTRGRWGHLGTLLKCGHLGRSWGTLDALTLGDALEARDTWGRSWSADTWGRSWTRTLGPLNSDPGTLMKRGHLGTLWQARVQGYSHSPLGGACHTHAGGQGRAAVDELVPTRARTLLRHR